LGSKVMFWWLSTMPRLAVLVGVLMIIDIPALKMLNVKPKTKKPPFSQTERRLK
jgi:hypothetical protein